MAAAGQAEGDGDEQRTEGQGGPKTREALEPVAAAFDAPDIVEGAFDAIEHEDSHKNEQGHAGDAERAAAGVADEFVDVLRDHELRGHAHMGGIGGRDDAVGVRGSVIGGQGGGNLVHFVGGRERGRGHDLGDKFVYGMVNLLFTLFFEKAAGDADGNGQQGNHGQQGGIGQGGSADETAVLDEAFAGKKPEMDEMLQAASEAGFLFFADGDFTQAPQGAFGHGRKRYHGGATSQ